MSLFKRSSGGWTPEPIIPPFPGAQVPGMGAVTPSMEGALRAAAVWACVQLIADTISMMPLNAGRRVDGIFIPIGNPAWLTSPDGVSSLPDWLYTMCVSLLLRGNSPGEVVDFAGGWPSAIQWKNPDLCQFRPTKRGTVDLTVREDGTTREIDSGMVFMPKGYRFPGLAVGLSPLKFAASTLGLDIATQAFALGYFREGLNPSAVLTSDQAIGQDDARTLKERVLEHVGTREPLVLGGGVKLTPLAISPEESQFLATQKWNTATIARWFRVPPEMIGAEAGNSMTYSNVEQRAIDFLTYTIQPWLTRIEAAMSTLLPRGQEFMFDTSVLLRTDLETTLRATAIGIASRQIVPDEARAMRQMPPLTTAQKKLLDLVPLTVAPTGRPSSIPPGTPGPVQFFDDTEDDPADTPTGGSHGPTS